MDKNKIKENLAKNLELYVKTFLASSYSRYMKEDRKKFLSEITNFKDYIKIEETGTISLFVGGNNIYFPESAFKIINTMKAIPGYGINKNHKTCQDNTLLTNDNTFLDYIMHIFVAGCDVEKYYQENLLHETMHFCGSNGGRALSEGMTEYITRNIAKEYSFLTSGCGYPKEIKIVLELEKIFGEEVTLQIAFSKDQQEIDNLLSEKFGNDAVSFYREVEILMNEEFWKKYYSHEFPGITGPLKKTLKYRDINYDVVYQKIEEYKERKMVNGTK